MRKRLIATMAVIGLMLSGCGGNSDPAANTDVKTVGAGSAGSSVPETGEAQVPSEVLAVRYASVGGLTDAPIYLADALGYFDEEGLDVEIIRMPNAAALATAIATGNLDVSAVSTAPALFNSITQGVNLKLVADKQSNQGDKGFGLKLVAKDTFVKAKDAGDGGAAIKGARVAISAKNTASDKILTDLLEHWGLQPEDITVVELPYPDMAAALQTGSVDAAIDLEPFLTRILSTDSSIQVFSDLNEVVPVGAPIVPLVYSEQILTNQAAADGFMRAYLRGTGVMNQVLNGDHPDKEDLIGVIAKQADLTEDIVRNAQPPGNNPCQPLDVEWIKQAQEFFVERGVVKEAIDIEATTDNSYGDRARQVLKEKGQLDFCS